MPYFVFRWVKFDIVCASFLTTKYADKSNINKLTYLSLSASRKGLCGELYEICSFTLSKSWAHQAESCVVLFHNRQIEIYPFPMLAFCFDEVIAIFVYGLWIAVVRNGEESKLLCHNINKILADILYVAYNESDWKEKATAPISLCAKLANYTF